MERGASNGSSRSSKRTCRTKVEHLLWTRKTWGKGGFIRWEKEKKVMSQMRGEENKAVWKERKRLSSRWRRSERYDSTCFFDPWERDDRTGDRAAHTLTSFRSHPTILATRRPWRAWNTCSLRWYARKILKATKIICLSIKYRLRVEICADVYRRQVQHDYTIIAYRY